ncbi:MAG: BREX system P-loop protein BrxC [Tepidisphaeraceae bacterium]
MWVSGFFGSGKSHLIKILSYLLRDQSIMFGGMAKRPVEFLTGKIADAMLLGDMKRAVGTSADVILFNIDSKASHQSGRDAILHVFLKVLNEMQGYSPDHPHIAHMERYLAGKGKLEAFHAAFRQATGSDWVKERDAYEFNRDQVITAMTTATGQSVESAEKWIDNAEKNFSLTVENFAKWVKDYLDTKGSNHRLVFVVDEVGQFIGSDSHLMLSLQTITEELGTVCKGRAWVVVTSQEDIDSVVGEVTKAKSNDFSKIQGRFKTRLSLSSSNVDEVIQSRLLAKDGTVVPELEKLFADKGDIIRNQLTFTNVGMTLKAYADATDFVKNYPFVPYQFVLLQKIFEAIRRHGIGGRHLSRGERSLLDAFQSAAKQIASQQVGVLAPLYRFYPAIESFLDTAVTMTIEQSAERNLEAFDIELLKVLFLIRYVEEVKGNVDNLVTLCTDEIDADRLALRRKIEASLGRLEKETLIARNGDLYAFLTNEEQDIKNEIKAVELTGGEESKLLGEIVFEDVLKGQRKHRYSVNKMDFPFTRLCDQHPVGSRVENGLVVSVVSPLDDDYAFYTDEKCKLESGTDQGQVLIKLADVETLGREVRTFKKTEKYINQKSDPTLSETTKRVLRQFADENRERRTRLVTLLSDLLASARYYVAGQVLAPKSGGASGALDEALEYLVKNTFTKMGLIKRLHTEPLKEIQAVLRTNDIGQLQLGLNAPDSNSGALADLRQYVELAGKTSKQIVLFDMIEGRFASRRTAGRSWRRRCW